MDMRQYISNKFDGMKSIAEKAMLHDVACCLGSCPSPTSESVNDDLFERLI